MAGQKYTGINDPALPANVKTLPESARESWLALLAPEQEEETKGEYDTVAMMPPLAGAQSWDEVDTYEVMAEEARNLEQVSCQAQTLFSNIMSNPDLTLEDKQQLISDVAAGMSGRLAEEGEKSLTERVTDFLLRRKAVWSQAFINDLPDTSFGFVETGGDKDEDGKTVPRSLRHFPFKDAAGKVDLPHLRNALARATQSPFGSKAMPKLDAAARAAGIGGRKAISDGGYFSVQKDAAGQWRWLAIVSNKFLDRDEEILAEDAHREFVEHVDKTGEYPRLELWHTPGSRVGIADMVEYADGFRLDSGTFDKGMEPVAESLSKWPEPLAMSHGFEYKPKDKKGGVYRRYRTFEDSVLPADKAANIWTQFATVDKEEDMPLTKEKREFLVAHLGEGRVNQLEAGLPALSKELEEKGVEWKDFDDLFSGGAEEASPQAEAAAPPDPKPVPNGDGDGEDGDGEESGEGEGGETPAEAREPALAQAELAAVVTGAVAAGLAPIQQELAGIKSRLDEVEKSEDEKMRDALSTRRQAPVTTGRPSESGDNLLPDDLAKKVFGENYEEEKAEANPATAYVNDLINGRYARSQ